MDKIKDLKNVILTAKRNLDQNTLDSLLWLVNILPNLVGFSIPKKKGTEPFWIIHLGLLVYIYAVGSLVYQINYAQGTEDFIKSYVNISILIMTANISYWFLIKRSLLIKVLKKVCKNDEMSQQQFALERHRELLSVIKKILFIFYGFNLINEFFVYLPNRVNVHGDNYSMTLCVGIEPLSKSPKREICQAILCTQELTIMTVVLNYQALLIILIAHTAAMYTLMAEEMSAFSFAESNNVAVKEKLASLIRRHSLTLSIIEDLKLLYSMPIGVNFGTNAVCMCLFFYLPLQEWIKFMPVLVYCFLVYFLYCFIGQRLINASELFETAIYCCGWENFDLKEMKMVYVMLLQAQKPVELLAADIIPVNISTFAATLQGMYKFVTVVKF